MAKFLMGETIYSERIDTVRLGTGTGAANEYGDAEKGKAVKLVGDSRYALCAAGDAIEAVLVSVRGGRTDDYGIGGIVSKGHVAVTFDGLQGTPGTGTVAVGDYVLTGTVVAKDTALTAPLKVTKATTQATAMAAPYKARVVSLGQVGTGAVGTTGLIELL